MLKITVAIEATDRDSFTQETVPTVSENARSLKLDFVALAEERYDLLLSRPDFFDPPLQTLMDFARSPTLARRAERMGGYDVSGLGTVRFNAH